MKKNDLLILIALFALWMAWPGIWSRISPAPPEVESTDPVAETPVTPSAETVQTTEPTASPMLEAAEPKSVQEPTETPPESDTPENAREVREILENDAVRLTFSSHGATLVEAVLKEYQAENREDSPSVTFDFSDTPSAAYQGIQGFGAEDGFVLADAGTPNQILFERTVGGLTLQRRYTLEDPYVLMLEDTFLNRAGEVTEVPETALQTGVFYKNPNASSMPGLLSLGVDTLAADSENVRHAANKEIKDAFKDREGWVQTRLKDDALDWVAAKNKYFVQILTPEDGGQYATAFGQWDAERNQLGAIGARLHFPAFILQPQAAYTRMTEIYTGPKKLSLLEDLYNHKDGIMQLGWWFLPWIGARLLWMINGIQGVIGNYGIAIMAVTVLMRILFWPLTHKGTESMRRMSELSPQMKELSEKYKDNPQKRQEALMKFYKEHKINPLGGCLPMLVQIPIFLSLFYVLKSAIELRFAEFLWISDLSEPDRLFNLGFSLPVLGSDLNLLPFLMAISMYLQQKVAPMTPATATDDTQQQVQRTMMRMMPIMMFFVLYNFAAGLALYWTTQNVLMIVQHLVYKKRKELRESHEHSED